MSLSAIFASPLFYIIIIFTIIMFFFFSIPSSSPPATIHSSVAVPLSSPPVYKLSVSGDVWHLLGVFRVPPSSQDPSLPRLCQQVPTVPVHFSITFPLPSLTSVGTSPPSTLRPTTWWHTVSYMLATPIKTTLPSHRACTPNTTTWTQTFSLHLSSHSIIVLL